MQITTAPYWQKLALGLTLLLGLGLWWCNFNARGLFLDEANLALNVSELSWAELFGPLRYEQYAPPLYLVCLKALGSTLGYDEAILRLPSLLGSILTLVGLVAAGRRLGLKEWSLAPVAFCFVSPLVLRYVGELKPYALDMGLAAMIIAWTLSKPKPQWWQIPIGISLVWLSFPAIFCLAATGIYVLTTSKIDSKKWLLIGTSWVLGFAVLYTLLLDDQSSKSGLQTYHSIYFFPWKFWTLDAWINAARLSQFPLKHGFGYTVLAQVVSSIAILCFLLTNKRDNWRIILLLLGPTLLAVGASVLGKYSLIPRLMLFSFPGLWLAAAIGWQWLQNRLAPKWGMIVPAVVLLLIPGTNVIRHYRSPLQVGQVKNMLNSLSGTNPVFVDYWAIPALRYYREIHEPKLGPNVVYHYCEDLCPSLDTRPPYTLIFSMKTIEGVNQKISETKDRLSSNSTKIQEEFFFRGQIIKVGLK
ncbi:MAG: hypothetical protein AAFY91_02895 [Bacteroidota bacterium]